MEGALQKFPTQQTDGASKGLVAKLLAAIGEIQLVPKRGRNEFNSYNYATAEDIISAVRGPLCRNGLLVFSSLRDRTSETITTAQGKPAFRERITMRFVVTDGDSELHFDVPGEGQDTGDKGIYKALTGATKYALRSLLQLPIGDDPEADGHEVQKSHAKAQPPLVMPKPQGSAQPPLAMSKPQGPQPPMVVAPPAAQPPANPNMATERQVKAIHALAKAVGIDEAYLTSNILMPMFNVKDAAELSRAHASQLLDMLKEEQSRGSRPAP